MKSKLLLLLSVVITLFSCQKEIDSSVLGGPGNSNGCKLDKAYFYDSSGALLDTAGYVYAGNQVTRVNYAGFYVTFAYSNNKVSKRTYKYENFSDSISIYDQFTYNSDGTLSKEQEYLSIPTLSLSFVLYSF